MVSTLNSDQSSPFHLHVGVWNLSLSSGADCISISAPQNTLPKPEDLKFSRSKKVSLDRASSSFSCGRNFPRERMGILKVGRRRWKGKRTEGGSTEDIFPLKDMLGRAFPWIGQRKGLDRASHTALLSFGTPMGKKKHHRNSHTLTRFCLFSLVATGRPRVQAETAGVDFAPRWITRSGHTWLMAVMRLAVHRSKSVFCKRHRGTEMVTLNCWMIVSIC